MSGKRTYTVPVLLLILTVLAILIILLYSSMLLNGQSLTTERGQRLAEQYKYCQTYADALNKAASGRLNAKSASDNIAAAAWQGKAELAGGECVKLLSDSGTRSGKAQAEAAEAAQEPVKTVQDKLEAASQADGELSDQARNTLTTILSGSAQLKETLQTYTVPTGDQRIRQMEAGVDWVSVAQSALKQLQQMAAALS